MWDRDTANSGVSACIGPCKALWPAVTTTSAKPAVTGITGTLATITRVDGGKHITINGLPIYTFSKDSKPGDTNGRGVLNIWHVLSPAGAKISTANPSKRQSTGHHPDADPATGPRSCAPVECPSSFWDSSMCLAFFVTASSARDGYSSVSPPANQHTETPSCQNRGIQSRQSPQRHRKPATPSAG